MRDNTTGLIWQTHTASGSNTLRAADKQYTHYTSTTLAQKVNTDPLKPTPMMVTPSQADIDAVTNLVGFQRQLNTARLCGSSAWRAPTESELKGLASSSAQHAEWLPNSSGWKHYWSSSSSTVSESSFSYFWSVDIANGSRYATFGMAVPLHEVTNHVMLVHN